MHDDEDYELDFARKEAEEEKNRTLGTKTKRKATRILAHMIELN